MIGGGARACDREDRPANAMLHRDVARGCAHHEPGDREWMGTPGALGIEAAKTVVQGVHAAHTGADDRRSVPAELAAKIETSGRHGLPRCDQSELGASIQQRELPGVEVRLRVEPRYLRADRDRELVRRDARQGTDCAATVAKRREHRAAILTQCADRTEPSNRNPCRQVRSA